ncbi:MAG: glycosyltransferase family 2 protein [Prevotella sp.]
MRRNVHQECSITIITVNYNGLKDTCALLDSITPLDDSMEVIVVDNASKDNEADKISSRYPGVKVLQSHTNLGFAGGNNLGIKQARGRYIFFINNDALFSPTELKWLVERIESSPNTAIVCPKIRFYHGERNIQYAGFTPLSKITLRNKSIGFGERDNGNYDEPHPTPYAHGAAMLVRRDAIDHVGLMPECYFLYYEEMDWSVMMKRGGYEIWYEPRCTIYHKESQATGVDSPLKTYYLSRNRLLFARRNIKYPTLLATYCYLIFIVILKDIFKHAIHGRTDLMKATIRGLIDFLKL